MPEFWTSAGLQLLEENGQGWLKVTPDFVRAYLARPELRPVEESCAEEVRLFEELMADPFLDVPEARLQRLADPDAASNYRVLLRFRAVLTETGTIEGTYLHLMRTEGAGVPPLFMDQLAHVILRNGLKDVTDPLRLRAAELFFRDQKVSTEDGHVMLADEEVVEMHSQTGGAGSLGQLLAASGTPMRTVALDVLSEDNKEIYWARSDRFDTVIDFRFGQPAMDAFARVIEAWIRHFLQMRVRVQPLARIDDDDWRWHIGLDRESARLLDALYLGNTPPAEDMARILALFRMEIEDQRLVLPEVRGRPVYLGLAMTADKHLKMKPQNLLANLPLLAGA